MSLGEELANRIAVIRSDKAHGATDLAREALEIMRWVAEKDGVERLPQTASSLTAARPTMAAIKNAVRRVVDDPAAMASPSAAVDAIRHVREWIDYDSSVVVENAANTIPEGSVVVTCSYSSAVLRTLIQASALRISVRVLESRVKDVAHGERLAKTLRAEGVASQLIADEGIDDALDGAALVLVGADRVLPSGALVNGVPSFALAQAAQGRAPFYAICESFKLDDSKQMEPGFDLIPPGLVTGYITEHGVIAPREVWAVHQRA